MTLGSSIAALLIASIPSPSPQDEAGGSPVPEAGGRPGEISPDLAEDLAMLEAMLRVRESRVSEARRFEELERDVLDTVRQQRPSGAVSARQVELVEVRYASASALLEAREAERDELAIRLESLRGRASSPSPEEDRDELRTRLDAEVRIRQAQLRAREARVKAAEAQIASERQSQENFMDSVRRGVSSVGSARQAMFRLSEATTWRDTMAAERDVARLRLERAMRRLSRFDDPESADPTLDRTDPEDLEARVSALEHMVDVLRDEMYHMQWELQLFRNKNHERIGTP
ncbi:hypothetical protein [Tautonia plasticadhaerens]|uniref:Uncharacterized protein n=1 Tax=Tautonia plasticadhaerens TaxID=2527974 RepID=A0A518GZP8_9BACT|nr:hypothetical protein [Tautonia plasticadhaerens]QDV34065.1 hypothetical protein ElP_19470 [Tautonia plasticadhaerens]